MADKRPTRLTRTQVIEMAAVLKEHCKPIPDQAGYCAYEEGWSDEKIADAFKVTVAGVRGLRLEVAGKLRAHRVGEDNEALRAEIETLRGDLLTVSNNLKALWDLHARLCDTLSINKVLDVKHLKGIKPAEAHARANGEPARHA